MVSCLLLQHLQATGGSSVSVPYTLRLSNPAYTALETSWTWEGSFAGGGAASGQVTQVLRCPKISSFSPGKLARGKP